MEAQRIEGYWWLPDRSIDDSVAGTLVVEQGRRPVVDLRGSLYDTPPIFHEARFEPLILGVTGEGTHVSLLRATLGSRGFKQDDEAILHQEWVGQCALVGHHATPDVEPQFAQVDIEIDALTRLSPSGLDRAIGENQRIWTWTEPPTLKAAVDQAELSLQLMPHGGLVGPETHELRFWEVPRLRVVATNDGLELAWIIDELLPALVDLCSLLLGKPASSDRVGLFHMPPERREARFMKEEIELVLNPSRRPEPSEQLPEPVTNLQDSPIPFSKLVPAWLRLWSDSDAHPVIDRLFRTEGRPSAFPEVTLLGYAVFLEGFHKATATGDGGFGARLLALFHPVQFVLDATKADPKLLKKVVVDTRNTLAHGKPRRDDSTVTGEELKALNSLLNLIIRATLLQAVGFTSEQLQESLGIALLRVRNATQGARWVAEG